MHLILKIGISRNTECVNTVGFPKLGHKCDVIALTQGITVWVIDFCMKTLKPVTWLLSGN